MRDVHALREHYVCTVAGLAERSRRTWAADALIGEEVARVWRLYLVGAAMAFRDGRMGVDQMLAVRPDGRHSLPPARAW